MSVSPSRFVFAARIASFLLLTALLLGASTLRAQEWRVVKPSNTGVPGEQMQLSRWAPDGRLWVAARWPFWGEGGLAIWDPAEESWTVMSNWETPLPSQFVGDLEFEADGTAWIATGGGLVKLDGDTWSVWDSSNSPMAHDGVADISLAPNGHVWVNNSSNSGGGDAIWDFDGVGTWVRYAVGEQLPWALPWTDLSQVFVDSNGTVWVANEVLQGVARFDGTSWTLLGADVNRFEQMAEDQFGNLWLNANLVGGLDAFHRFDGQQFTTWAQSEPTVLRSDPATGTIYFANWFGEVRRTTDGGQTIEPFLNGLNIIFDVSPRSDGEVWVSTIGALGQFTATGDWVRDFNSYNTGFPFYFVDDFFTDRDGYFWVTTGEAGLSRTDGLRWRNWGDHNLGAEPYPFAGNEPMGAVYQDSTGTHWFGGNGIARWESGPGEITGFWNWQNNPGMGVTQFRDFAEDGDGRLFAVTGNGAVFRFDVSSQLWVWEQFVAYSPLSDFPGMLADAQGDVWVVGWFDLWRWDRSTWTKLVLPDPNTFFDLGGINDFDIAPDGVFWFGTAKGLVSWDGTAFTVFDTANSPLPGPNVSGVDAREDGLLAVACSSFSSLAPAGVAVISGDPALVGNWSLSLYGSSPLPHYQLGDCHFDAQGDLWVSATSEGVAVLDTGAWDDLREPLAGTHGTPHLLGAGLPLEGHPITISLSRAVEASPSYLILGFDTASVWFFGGTLVPFPSTVLPPMGTGLHGSLTAGSAWPAGVPSGTTLYAQSWIADPGAPLGFSATNAVSVTVP